MHLIDKKTKVRQRSLSNYYQNILLNPEQYDDVCKKELANFLYKIKEHYWIECNCNCSESFLVIYSSKYQVSVRCKERKKHRNSCVFFIKNLDLSLDKASHLVPTRRVRTYDLYAINHMYTSNATEFTNGANISNTSKLGQALYTFFTDSKCHIYEFGRNHKSLYQQLKAFAAAVQLPCNKISQNLLLKSVYRYSMSEQSINYAKQDIRTVQFPKHLQPFILFSTRSAIVAENSFSVAREVDKKWRAFQFNVESGIKKPSSWIGFKNSSPFFLLATYILNAKTNQYKIKDAFAMPICGLQNIMPVESDYERKVLKLLIDSISKRSNQEEYLIEKPLFASKTEDGEIYRPDFVIRTEDKLPIFIEVLGSPNEDYQNQKNIISRRAKKYCRAYISIKGYEFDKEKTEFIRKIQSQLDD